MKILKHKFKAKPQVIDDIRFASKKEMNRYLELLKMQKNGEILFFLRQVTFEDVKGYRTELYKTKKKIVEDEYPIVIKEI